MTLPTRPRASLERVLADLGSTVLELVAAPASTEVDVTAVSIYDPLDDLQVAPGALLLGVSIAGVEQICSLLTAAGASRAAGLVVKSPVPADEKVHATVQESGVALVGLTRAASWSQVAALLRSRLSEGDVAGPDSSDDLFGVANAVAELLDAPVTIEDRSSRVLAYSGRQEEADEGRIATIIGRQVPERYQRILEERGYFRELYRSREPVYLEPAGDNQLARAAVAIRAGDEILGSMWAAVHGPLSQTRNRAFSDAAKVVALHLLGRRAGIDSTRRLRADLLATVLEAGPDAGEAAGRLGVSSERLCVLSAELVAGGQSPTELARQAMERERLCDALGMHLAAIHPSAAAALLGRVVYAVLPVQSAEPEAQERAVRIAESFLARTGGRTPARIGVGRLAHTLAEIAVSRADADRALRVLRARGSAGAAAYTDLHLEALLLQLGDIVTAQRLPPSGPYARIAGYDAKHGTDLVKTLAAHLDAFGDVNKAADAVHVHPNTFRYRLRRLCEIGQIDLSDPEARLEVQLQMRLYRRRN